MKTNKKQMILNHLKANGYITSIEAIDLYGETRLSDKILRLRADGYDIETVMVPFVDRYGNKNRYGRYVLKG